MAISAIKKNKPEHNHWEWQGATLGGTVSEMAVKGGPWGWGTSEGSKCVSTREVSSMRIQRTKRKCKDPKTGIILTYWRDVNISKRGGWSCLIYSISWSLNHKLVNRLIAPREQKRRDTEWIVLVFTKTRGESEEEKCWNRRGKGFILYMVSLTSLLEVKWRYWTCSPRRRSEFKSLSHSRSVKIWAQIRSPGKVRVEERAAYRALKTPGSLEEKDRGDKEEATEGGGEVKECGILKASEEYFKQRRVTCVPHC